MKIEKPVPGAPAMQIENGKKLTNNALPPTFSKVTAPSEDHAASQRPGFLKTTRI
jgi:hypothetical protein